MCRILLKYILFAVNLICTVVGLALIVFGVAVLYHIDEILEIFEIDLSFVPYLIITLGVIVFLIAFCGCCGAITESKCLLITYGVCMAILAAVKIYLTVELLNNLSTHKSTIEDYVDDAFTNPESSENFHILEALLHCCGTIGPDFYENTHNNLMPPTCCENPSETTVCPKEEAYEAGCTSTIGDTFESVAKTIGMTLIGIIIVEVVAMTSSILIIVTAKPKKGDYTN